MCNNTLAKIYFWFRLLESMVHYGDTNVTIHTADKNLDVIKAQAAFDAKTQQVANFRRLNPGKVLLIGLAEGLERTKVALDKALDEAQKKFAKDTKREKILGHRAREANVVLEKDEAQKKFAKLYRALKELGKKNATRLSMFVPKSEEERVKSLLGELVPLSESFRISADSIKDKYPV